MKKNREKIKINKGLLITVIVVFLLLIVAAAKMDQIEEFKYSMRTVDINGTDCREKQNVEVYLMMGIDADADEISVDNPGQCDSLFLFIFDRKDKTYGVLPINRNTIMDVATLDEEGNVVASTDMQLALAHATGDGKEMSCENVVNSLTTFLYGHKIDGYMSFTLDSIEKLNHELGGVTVKIKDDLTDEDPTLIKGQTVRLTDSQAVTFVRGRMGLKDDTNVNRMNRQVQYVEGIRDVIIERMKSNMEYGAQMYDSLYDYTVTDIQGSQMTRLTKAMLEYEYTGVYDIKGKTGEDELGFAAFTPSEDSKAEVAKALLYNEK